MEINREDERPNVVMQAKDKDDINQFSTHLARRNDLRMRIARRKKLIQLHDDAADELVIMDDDADVFYNIGDVFIMDDKAQIETSLDKVKDDLAQQVGAHEDELRDIENDMLALKASLYAKFGKVRVKSSFFFCIRR